MVLQGFSLQRSLQRDVVQQGIPLQQSQSQPAQAMTTTGQQHVPWLGVTPMQPQRTQPAKGGHRQQPLLSS